MILENARGYVYCVSSMGVTGQAAHFHKNVRNYLESVKAVSKIPVMMGFGIRTAEDVAGLKDTIDAALSEHILLNLWKKTVIIWMWQKNISVHSRRN